MRRGLATAAGLAANALFVFGGGCTFLVSFDEVPSNDAAVSSDTFAPPPPTETGPLPAEDSGGLPPPDPAKCDLEFNRGAIMGCAAYDENGQICGDSAGLTNYPGDAANRAKDVVTCSKQKGVICVQHCATACAHLPNTFPDQCDECAGKADGTYCGIQMGWPTKNFQLLVRCTNGRMVQAAPNAPKNCANGCKPNPEGMATCM